MNSSGESGSVYGAVLIRLAALAVVPACLLFTQAHTAEALLCLPLIVLGNRRLVVLLTGVCVTIAVSVVATYLSRMGLAAMPSAMYNSHYGPFRSGDIILAAIVFAVLVFAICGNSIATPNRDPIVAIALPGFARPIRLILASTWPMLPIVALPFGLVSVAGALVWGVVIALFHHALWTGYGRVHPEPIDVKAPRPNRYMQFGESGLIAVFTIVVLLPFANKPFHIDDPAYLWTAQQIVKTPIDFYGFNLHMNGMLVPMHMEMQNPPLFSYVLAAVAIATSWNEWPMHVVSLAFTLAAVLGTYVFAQRFCVNAWAAALAMLSAPGFFVSATTVMCDIPMIAFYVWAAHCWLTGYDRSRHGYLVVAALLIAIAALTKYFGMTMIPLLFVYSVVQSGGLRARQLYLIIPVVILTAYEMWTRDFYDRGLLLGASEYVRNVQQLLPEGLAPSWLAGLMFIGGSLGTIAIIGMTCARGKTAALLSLGILITTIVVAGLLFLARPSIEAVEELTVPNIWLGALFAALSLLIVTIALTDLFRNPGPDSLLLAMWLGGSILFCVAANWTVNVRALLPAVVPAAILMVRQLEMAQGATCVRNNSWRIIAATGCALAISMLIARGDTAYARYERAMARAIATVHMNSGTLWFDGRWGLEYYLRTYGGKTLITDEVRPGDRVALPERADADILLPGRELSPTHEVLIPRQGAYQTMFAGAGFYSSLFGPLPFAIGDAPVDQYRLYDVIR